MSYEFRVRGTVILDIQRVSHELLGRGIDCTEPDPLFGTMSCARLASSLRPVSVAIDNNQATIRVNAYSAPADYAVALEVVEVLMPSSASRFQAEGSRDWLPKEVLRDRFPESWTLGQSAGSFGVLAARAAAPNNPVIIISGTRANFLVGGRFVAKFPRQEAGRALERAFHRLQHIEEEGYEIAEHVPLVPKHAFITAAKWNPRTPTVIRSPNRCAGGLDFVQVEDAGKRVLFPASALEAVSGAALELLDEVSVALPARSDHEVAACMRRAGEHAWTAERVRSEVRRRRLVGLLRTIALLPLLPLRSRSPAACRASSALFLLAASLLFFTLGIPSLGREPGTTLAPAILSGALLLYGIVLWFRARHLDAQRQEGHRGDP